MFDGAPITSNDNATHAPAELDLSALTALTRLEFRNYPTDRQKLTWQRLEATRAQRAENIAALPPTGAALCQLDPRSHMGRAGRSVGFRRGRHWCGMPPTTCPPSEQSRSFLMNYSRSRDRPSTQP